LRLPRVSSGTRTGCPSPVMVTERVTARYPELELTSEARADAPVRVLLDAAAESELLVVGSRGLGGLAGFLVGSVSQAVIAHASRPVAVVRGEEPPETGPGRPVVVGLDLQHHHAAVLEYAFEAAARSRSPLRVVHTWSLQELYAYPSALPDPEVAAAVREEAHRGALAALAPVHEAFPEVDAELSLLSGATAPELLAASEDAGLVVVGRRSRKRLSLGTHIGPVTHAVLHHAKQPVTVVPYE
ncbi:universal stress protein, partial [Streptomyces sp. NPDC048845]|uniref:universal stress protein n=1 Tax=Streptomyces sp. NPDC048845 TaxID=3155390 RepID=UPI00343DCC6E